MRSNPPSRPLPIPEGTASRHHSGDGKITFEASISPGIVLARGEGTMSSASTPSIELAVQPFLLSCWRCRTTFDALAAAFCGCLASDRTLQCPSCLKCSCAAPPVFRRKFWKRAPQALRARQFFDHTLTVEEPERPSPAAVKTQRGR